MQYFLFGILALAAALLLLRRSPAVNADVLLRVLSIVVGVASLAAGAIILTRGWSPSGLGLTALGAVVLLRLTDTWRYTFGRAAPRTKTEFLDVAVDPETGKIRGRVLKGFFAGRGLSSLRAVELAHLWADCQFADPQAARILADHLDRMHPTWRDDMAGGAGERHEAPDGKTRMTRYEALDILGLEPNATQEDIRRAHRDLMLKLHPDRGGSHTLAAKVNEAKDVLLG